MICLSVCPFPLPSDSFFLCLLLYLEQSQAPIGNVVTMDLHIVIDCHTRLHVLQVALTVHVAMTAYQSVIYDWVKATGTLRLSPYDPRIGKSHRHNFAPLNNKCMELRKVTDTRLCCATAPFRLKPCCVRHLA